MPLGPDAASPPPAYANKVGPKMHAQSQPQMPQVHPHQQPNQGFQAQTVGNPVMDPAAVQFAMELNKKTQKSREPIKWRKMGNQYVWQFTALYIKCYYMMRNNPSLLLSIVLLPVLFVLMIEGMRQFESVAPKLSNFAGESLDGSLPACKYFDLYYQEFGRLQALHPCVQVLYGPPGSALAQRAVAKLAEANPGVTTETAASEREMFGKIYQKLGKYDTSIWFDDANNKYTMWVNGTASELYERVGDYFHYVKVQSALENALLKSAYSDAAGLELRLEQLPQRDSGAPTATETQFNADGPTNFAYWDATSIQLVMFGLILSSCNIIQLVVSEKRTGSLKILRVMGLKEMVYWTSWFSVFMLFFLVVALAYATTAVLTGCWPFYATNFFVLAFTAWCFLSANVSWTLFFCSFIQSPRGILGAQLLLIAAPIFLHSYFSGYPFNNPTTMPADFFTRWYHPDNTPVWVFLTNLLPSYHLAKVMLDVYAVTGTGAPDMPNARSAFHAHERYTEQHNNDTNTFTFDLFFKPVGYNRDHGFPRGGVTPGVSIIPGAPMNWTITLQNNETTQVRLNATDNLHHWIAYNPTDEVWVDKGTEWWAPSPFENCMYMLAITPVMLLLSWYFSQVCSAGEGKSLPWYFPLSKTYWFGPEKVYHDPDDKVGQTKARSENNNSIVCLKMSKSYASQTALRELTLEMENRKIFCMLGQNGAGKSTTVNLLTGLHPITHGSAFYNGLSVREDIASIQESMGICPQDHIFFDELTGKQHIEFWARFKGISNFSAADVDALLDSVVLLDAKNKLAKHYSGGMQRKLSVAMSSVGSPKLIFLDEPTTGLDPVSRRHIWNFIEKLKNQDGGKVICLTTHSMEEADFLADRIGIMSKGVLKVLGTSLSLKNKYGTGFRFTMNCEEKNAAEILAYVKQKLPGAKVLIQAGTNLTIGVPRSLAAVMPDFLQSLEDRVSPAAGLITEYGIANSTLEEVFLNITASDRPAETLLGGDAAGSSGDAAGGGMDGMNVLPTCVLCCSGDAVCVTAYTRVGAPFLVDGVICRACAEGTRPGAAGGGKADAAVARAIEEGTHRAGPPALRRRGPAAIVADCDAESSVGADSDMCRSLSSGGSGRGRIQEQGNRTRGEVRSELEEVEALCRGLGDQERERRNRFLLENEAFFDTRCDGAVFGSDGERSEGGGASESDVLSLGGGAAVKMVGAEEGEHSMAPAAAGATAVTGNNNQPTPMQQMAQLTPAQQERAMAQLQAQAPPGTQVVMTPQGPVAMTPAQMQQYQQQMIAYQQQQVQASGALQAGSAHVGIQQQGNGISEKRAETLQKKNMAQQFSAVLAKNFHLQKRQKRANICRACCICACVVSGLVMGLFSAAAMGSALQNMDIEILFDAVDSANYKRKHASVMVGMSKPHMVMNRTFAQLDAMPGLAGLMTTQIKNELLVETADTPYKRRPDTQEGWWTNGRDRAVITSKVAGIGEEYVPFLDEKRLVRDEEAFTDMYEKDVKKQPTSTNFGTFTPGYKLNYCPPQNLRFMHVDPSILTDRQMWKTALMESYSADESQWYYHNPVPLHMLNNFRRDTERNTASFVYEYHHNCGLQAESCVETDFVKGAATYTSAKPFAHGPDEHRVSRCGNGAAQVPVFVPQLGNLRTFRKLWQDELKGTKATLAQQTPGKNDHLYFDQPGRSFYDVRNQVREELVDGVLCADDARCKAHAAQYTGVDFWVDGAAAGDFDEEWLGLPKKGGHYSNQIRFLAMRLSVQNLEGYSAEEDGVAYRGAAGKFDQLQRARGAGATSDAENRCMPLSQSKLNTVGNRFGGARRALFGAAAGAGGDEESEGAAWDDDAASAEEGDAADAAPGPHRQLQPRGQGRTTRAALESGSNQDFAWGEMGSLRYMRGADFPKYRLEEFVNSNSSSAFVLPKKTFPDLIMSIEKAERSTASLKGTVRAQIRDHGYASAHFKKTCNKAHRQCDHADYKTRYSKAALTMPLYDNVNTMTAHYTSGHKKLTGDRTQQFAAAAAPAAGDPLAVGPPPGAEPGAPEPQPALRRGLGAAGGGGAADPDGVFAGVDFARAGEGAEDELGPRALQTAASAEETPAQEAQRGRCKFDFHTPTSPMQLHTLVSGLGNGARFKKQCAAQASDADRVACLNSNVVRADVLSHPTMFHRHVVEEEGGADQNVILVVPLISLLFFPVMTYGFGYEKKRGLLNLMVIQSLELWVYWLSSYLWYYFLYFCGVFLYFVVYAMVSATYDWGMVALTMLSWGHGQVALAVFISALFWRSESLTGVTYFIMMFTIAAAWQFTQVVPSPWPVLLMLYPATNFTRSLILTLKYSTTVTGASVSFWETATESERQEMSDLIMWQWVASTVLLAAGIFIHMDGTARLLNWAGEKLKTQKARDARDQEKAALWGSANAATGQELDADVVKEQTRIEEVFAGASGAGGSESGGGERNSIMLKHLRKVYKDGNMAVKGITLGVPRGQCFGLLGPNGAGKTSVINMMCGEQTISGGDIEIMGNDLKENLHKVHAVLGVCPQFDCVWDELTCEEHLMLYAKLKGIGRERQRVIVYNTAEMVGLAGDPFKKKACELSGGMRRRLSIAISLVTDPAVLILDEPTTGLDPDTRNGLWGVINRAAKSRAVILTTHSMEEADALCERIGIMCSGVMQCLGTPLHLKNKFGTGYTLSIALDIPEAVEEGSAFGEETPGDTPNARKHSKEGKLAFGQFAGKAESPAKAAAIGLLQKHIEGLVGETGTAVANLPSQGNMASFNLSGNAFSLSRIFRDLEQHRVTRALPIREWSIAKTTLDEVFIRIVNEHQKVIT